MGQRLTGMAIDKVALVDRGANGRTFAVFKRDPSDPDVVPDPERRSLLAKVAAALGLGPAEPVAKAQTFAAIIAGRELTDALSDSFRTLEDVLWQAIYALDDNDQPLSMEAKQALVGTNLDEFKAYLMAAMERGIAKQDATEVDLARARIDAVIEKVGKKISAARLQRLQEAATALTSVLAEVVSDEDTEAKKRAAPEEVEMTGDELAKALQPVMDRLADIEKRLPAADEKDGKVEKTADPKPDGDDAEIPEPVVKAFEAVLARVEGLEQARGVRKSVDGQDGTEVAKRGTWAGIL